MTEKATAAIEIPRGWTARQVIHESARLRLEYTGPVLGATPNAIVAFAPVDFPFQSDRGGWGTASFSKRLMPHVSVFHRDQDWHQHDEFFAAMQTCRKFFGPLPRLTSYGFSMGGYGAILGAQGLNAARAVAISPQSSIDPAAVKFERRYHAQWAVMNGWVHDLDIHVDDLREYVVLYDPLHKQDSQHEIRLPKPAGYRRVLLHGAGHAGIQSLVEMGQAEALFALLSGDSTPAQLRQAYRKKRGGAFRYQRKVGTILHDRRKPAARMFFDMAHHNGFHRLIKKWTPYYK